MGLQKSAILNIDADVVLLVILLSALREHGIRISGLRILTTSLEGMSLHLVSIPKFGNDDGEEVSRTSAFHSANQTIEPTDYQVHVCPLDPQIF